MRRAGLFTRRLVAFLPNGKDDNLREFEAVVVGGGCAGASAAFFLKHYSIGEDISTLLIERLEGAKFSKYHRMCGEAVSKRTFQEISPLRPSSILNEIKRVEERWPGEIIIRERARGYILDRPRFLEDVLRMYDRLGGETITDNLLEVNPGKDGFLLKLSSEKVIRTKFLIGADGAHSLVRRTLFKEEPSRILHMEQGVVQRKVAKDTIRFIHDEKYQGGYRWEFPYGELAKIGFPCGTDSEEEKLIEKHRRDIPIGCLSKLTSGKVCLVGDAAAQANPLTAGGIRISMLAGKRAAGAVVAQDLTQYESWWRRSKFSSSEFFIAFKHLEKLKNQDLTRAFEPLSDRMPLLSRFNASRSMTEFSDLHSAYQTSGKYGW